MKRVIYFILCIVVFCIIALCFVPRSSTVTDYAMNTMISVTARGKRADKAVNEAINEVKRIDSLMSVSLPSSDIYKINNAPPGEFVKVSRETYDLIEFSLKVSDVSDGGFDITVNPLSELWNIGSQNPKVPSQKDIDRVLCLVDYRNVRLRQEDLSVALEEDGMSITLGAIAKGYAADCATRVLKAHGIEDAVINLGGNIYALGTKTIGLQTPFGKHGEYFEKCTVTDMSVVTSGPYERYFEEDGTIFHHIINPKTGYPVSGDFKSVTVTAQSSFVADALSTAIFVSGEDIAEKFDVSEVIILKNDNKILRIK